MSHTAREPHVNETDTATVDVRADPQRSGSWSTVLPRWHATRYVLGLIVEASRPGAFEIEVGTGDAAEETRWMGVSAEFPEAGKPGDCKFEIPLATSQRVAVRAMSPDGEAAELRVGTIFVAQPGDLAKGSE